MVCKRNVCTCMDENGVETGIPARGEHQAECHRNNSNVCVKCHAYYRGPIHSDKGVHTQDCVPNRCICENGAPVTYDQCKGDGLEQCASCNDNYFLAESEPQNWNTYALDDGANTHKEQWRHIWSDRGGSLCLKKRFTTQMPFDCMAAQNNWELAWSPFKQHWCCLHAGTGCVPQETAKDSCEKHGFTKDECDSIGCCVYEAATKTCEAEAALEKEVCNPDFKIVSNFDGKCMKALRGRDSENFAMTREACLNTDPMQGWRPSKQGSIVNGGGLCLEVSEVKAGATVFAALCKGLHVVNQQFTYDPATKRLLTSPGSTLCVRAVIHDEERVMTLGACDPQAQWSVTLIQR